MLRIVLGVLAGFAAGVVTVYLIELASHALYPPPPGVDLTDPEQQRAFARSIPLGGLLMVLLAVVAGALIGTSTALIVAGRRRTAGWIVGGLMLAATIFNMTSVPAPVWLMIAEVVLVSAAVFLALRLFGRPATA